MNNLYSCENIINNNNDYKNYAALSFLPSCTWKSVQSAIMNNVFDLNYYQQNNVEPQPWHAWKNLATVVLKVLLWCCWCNNNNNDNNDDKW